MDNNAERIIDMLEAEGFEAYAVGGAVRDMLMNRSSNDWDITTNALPEETKKVFSDYPVIETGIKHGTVAVVIDKTVYEVTTYRTETGYADSRHPDEVEFVSDIKTDLSRRDFTVNAIAYSKNKGFLDFFGGIKDIEECIIRTVGDPYKRFSEDALRLLRALRFSSVLGFEIEHNTSEAIFELSDTIKNVSPERIYAELKKLLLGKNAQNVIDKYNGILKAVIPIKSGNHNIASLPLNFPMRLTELCGSAVNEALVFLRADNPTKYVCRILMQSTPIPEDTIELKHYISRLGREDAKLVIAYRRSLYNEDDGNKAEKLLTDGTCLFISDLAVDGNDLLKIGITGKTIGDMLDALLKMVIEEKIDNNKESLLENAKNIDNR